MSSQVPAPNLPEYLSGNKLIAGKYQVLSELGRGGFGMVVQAKNVMLNKLVAVKILHTTLLIDPTVRARFEQEAKSGAGLSHPHLVSVFDYGFTERDEPYLVMEYVEGRTLESLIGQKQFTFDELLEILIQVCKAVRYLHDNRIVHRDLKTSNILVQEIGGEKFARLLDLGIAKVFTPQGGTKDSIQMTSTGAIFGSPAYMSPEQCQGQNVDARSDIYSLGCVMYQCYSGELAFSGENSLQVILKHLHDDPAPLKVKTKKEEMFRDVVERCMAKEPTKRFQNVKDLMDSLQRVLAYQDSENAHVKATSVSRSYAAVSGPPPAPSPVMGYVLAGVVAIVLLACAVPLVSMLVKQAAPSVTVQYKTDDASGKREAAVQYQSGPALPSAPSSAPPAASPPAPLPAILLGRPTGVTTESATPADPAPAAVPPAATSPMSPQQLMTQPLGQPAQFGSQTGLLSDKDRQLIEEYNRIEQKRQQERAEAQALVNRLGRAQDQNFYNVQRALEANRNAYPMGGNAYPTSTTGMSTSTSGSLDPLRRAAENLELQNGRMRKSQGSSYPQSLQDIER